MTSLTLQSTFTLSSGHTMPRLGLGVYQNRSDCFSACLAALRNGYRHIDSAQIYKNEEEVGLAVRESGIARGDVFVTSKAVSKNHGYEKTLLGVQASLERFGFDYLDLFLVHDPLSGSKLRLDTYRALVDKMKDGSLRSIGVSNFGVKHLEELAANDLPLPSVNQIELHPWCQMRDVVEYCRSKGIQVQAYCPLTRALKFDDPTLRSVCASTSRSPAQVLVRWSLQKGYSPLPKSTFEARIVENADVFGWALSQDEMARLDSLDQGLKGAVSWGGSVIVWKEG